MQFHLEYSPSIRCTSKLGESLHIVEQRIGIAGSQYRIQLDEHQQLTIVRI
jgi:hypothetical protein